MGTIERAMERARRGGQTGDTVTRPGQAVSAQAVAEASGASATPVTRAPEAELDFRLLRAQGMLTPDDDQRALHEQYRLVKRTLIAHAFSGKTVGVNPANLIQVTSSVAGEGKTFTSFNLGMSLAMEVDFTALVVDADLTQRALTRLAGLSGRPGLTEVLEGSVTDLADVIHRTNAPRLALLPAGAGHARATELVASEAMRRVTRELATRYSDRLILLDSTPLCRDSQAATLAGHMGQVVVVVEAGRTPETVVREATGLLDDAAARAGLLLNKSPRGQGYAYYGGY